MDLTALSVLLVEDDDRDAELFQALLLQAGVAPNQVEHRPTLSKALEACATGRFDVVLLDLNLPDAEGVAAIRRLVEAAPEVPIVVLTGNEDEGSSSEALRAGAEDYLLKGETCHGDLLLRALRYAIERRRARDELSRLELHLLKAQRLESMEVLAGGVAHDFNNLLVGILGNATMALADLPARSDVAPLIQEIERSALLASELTKQMLAYAGKGRFVVSVVDLSELILETKGLLQASVSANAALRFEASSTPLPVRIDATQIQQTLMNLVTNASEALEGGTGTITISTGKTQVDSSYTNNLEYNQSIRSGSYAFLEVTDTGIGMEQGQRSRIFDPFFSTKFSGRGLGLAASLGIARGHEGAFRVYSEPNQGTSFKLLLPLSSGPKAEETKEDPPVVAGSAHHVLVVDDNESARNVAQRILLRAGFEVTTAIDGEEALAVFSTHRDEIDLVLLDLTMPKMDGEETCRRIRQSQPNTRVIMMSGYNEQEIVRRLPGRGIEGFLQKPFQPQTLLKKVREALDSNCSPQKPL